MSIGFPLAPAETGLSSVLTAKFQVRFRTRRCSGVDSDSIPLYWIETIDLATAVPSSLPSGIVGKGTFVAKNDALALMTVGVGTPTNVTALHALAVQMAKDFVLWRTVSHDIIFNGVIASPPNGLTDLCQWTLTKDEISTRQITQPLNGEPEEFNHNDPVNAGCVDVPGQLHVTKTPCTESYIPLWQSAVGSPSPLGAYRSQICLVDGRLIETFSYEDPLTCGCNNGGNPCLTSVSITIITCNPAQANGVLVVVKDQHGTTIGSMTTNSMPPGTALFLDWPCDNSAVYTVTITKTGFTTISQVISVVCCQGNFFMFNLLANPLPTITVNFHVASCESGEYDAACSPCIYPNSAPGINNVVVGLTVNGSLISCTTNTNGDCTINFPVNSLGSVYPVSATGGACVSPYVHQAGDDVTDSCLTQNVNRCIVLPADPVCHCFCCQNPRPANLFLTDSVYGAVNLTWTLCADGVFRYSGTLTAGYLGSCGCPAAGILITYFFDCGCVAGGPPPQQDTVYRFWTCFTQYDFFEVCGGSFQRHSCPGPQNPLNPGVLCVPATQIPYCPAPILGENGQFPLFAVQLQNTTAKCAVPLNVIFNSTGSCTGTPCNWNTICNTPWPTGASFTVTQ